MLGRSLIVAIKVRPGVCLYRDYQRRLFCMLAIDSVDINVDMLGIGRLENIANKWSHRLAPDLLLLRKRMLSMTVVRPVYTFRNMGSWTVRHLDPRFNHEKIPKIHAVVSIHSKNKSKVCSKEQWSNSVTLRAPGILSVIPLAMINRIPSRWS